MYNVLWIELQCEHFALNWNCAELFVVQLEKDTLCKIWSRKCIAQNCFALCKRASSALRVFHFNCLLWSVNCFQLWTVNCILCTRVSALRVCHVNSPSARRLHKPTPPSLSSALFTNIVCTVWYPAYFSLQRKISCILFTAQSDILSLSLSSTQNNVVSCLTRLVQQCICICTNIIYPILFT